MSPGEYLREMREPVPEWLAMFDKGERFPREQFFGSRVVYYPGCGTDGQPVRLFGASHAAHCFVYVDYGHQREFFEKNLDDPLSGFRGYDTLARVSVCESDLVPNGWVSHFYDVAGRRVSPEMMKSFARIRDNPFAFLEVMKRQPELDDNHGPSRLAILFIGADGIATYDALFCQQDSISPPFAIVLQDHGFGGNYDRFGRGGLFEAIAGRCNARPKMLLVATDTRPWNGYVRIPEVGSDRGGMHGNARFLYRYHENPD